MGESPRLIVCGSINSGSTLIEVDTTYLSPAVAVKVQLSVPYAMACPPAWTRPGMTGTDAIDLNYPRTLPAGAIVAFSKPESDALVAQGAASYV